MNGYHPMCVGSPSIRPAVSSMSLLISMLLNIMINNELATNCQGRLLLNTMQSRFIRPCAASPRPTVTTQMPGQDGPVWHGFRRRGDEARKRKAEPARGSAWGAFNAPTGFARFDTRVPNGVGKTPNATVLVLTRSRLDSGRASQMVRITPGVMLIN